MRDGILDQIPKVLPREQLVVVLGPANAHGQNMLKSLISDLNRDGEWIRTEFRPQIFEEQVPNKAGVVLTMVGLNHGSLANVRRAAKTINACCPNQAFTVGEAKEVLRFLENARQPSPPPGNHNGKNNGHPVPGRGEEQRLADLATSAQQISQGFSTILRDGVTEAEPPGDQPPENPDEVENALGAIERFRKDSEDLQLAVLVVGDKLKAVTAERDQLQERLTTVDAVIAELRASVEKFTKENTTLTQTNKGLESEVSKLRTTIGQFESLIRGVNRK